MRTILAAQRSLTSFDVPYSLVLSYVLDLPFGKGRNGSVTYTA
jgi:hypothetical protein